MKNLFSLALVAAIAMPAFAQEEEKSAEATPQAQVERKRASVAGPTFFAVSEFPASQDVTGLRLTIPFSTKQENVTGIDLGLWGRALYFQGFQINILRNDVKDDMSGFQCGLYNSIGNGQLLGLQVGLFNEANFLRLVSSTGRSRWSVTRSASSTSFAMRNLSSARSSTLAGNSLK